MCGVERPHADFKPFGPSRSMIKNFMM